MESQHTEWKQSWRDEYLKWVCGFANADGGVLLIGMNDKGEPVGIPNAVKLLEDLPNKIRDLLGIVVAINLVDADGLKMIEIRVEPHSYPVSYKGQYHLRSGSTKQELKGAALDRFLLKKRGLHWDGVPVPNVSLADNLTESAIQLFRDKAVHTGRMDDDVQTEPSTSLIEKLQLTEKHYLKRASLLLFSDNAERWVNGAYIKIGFFASDDDLVYQDEVHGNLFDQVEKTMDLLYTKYLKALISYDGLQRKETFPYPKPAIREALLNAIVHKDYSSGIPLQISVYDDKLYIWNSGQLPDDWTVESLQVKHPSSPFNPLIANAFFRAGYIESWGRGIEKINRECRNHGVQSVDFNYELAGLMIQFTPDTQHFPTKSNTEKGSEKGSEKTQDRILQLIRENNRISAKSMASELNLSSRAIEKHLSQLKQQNILKRIGADRGGHWKITQPAE